MAGREVLARPGEDHDTHGVVGVGPVEGGLQGVQQGRRLGVGGLGPVQGDGGDGAVDLVEHNV